MSSPHSPAQLSQDEDLQGGLRVTDELTAGRMTLNDLLMSVASFAVHSIPGADGAGLLLIEADRADMTVATAAFVREVDAIQYALIEGPCISAAEDGVIRVSASLGSDSRCHCL